VFLKHVADHTSVKRAIVDNNNPDRCSFHEDRLQEGGNLVSKLPLPLGGIHGVKTVFVG
jgi:hypothetical protein